MVYSSKPQCLKTERKTNKSGQSNHEQYCFSRLPVGCGSKRVLVEPPPSPSTPRHPPASPAQPAQPAQPAPPVDKQRIAQTG